MTRRHQAIDHGAARRLTLDTEPWLSCDDCFDQVDAVADDLVHGTGARTEAFRAHLVGCPACHEEARGLVTLVAAEAGRDPGQALRLFDEWVGTGAGRTS